MPDIKTGPSLDLLDVYELAIDELLEAADELRSAYKKLKTHARGSEEYLEAETDVSIAVSLVQVKALSAESLDDEITDSLPE